MRKEIVEDILLSSEDIDKIFFVTLRDKHIVEKILKWGGRIVFNGINALYFEGVIRTQTNIIAFVRIPNRGALKNYGNKNN